MQALFSKIFDFFEVFLRALFLSETVLSPVQKKHRAQKHAVFFD